MLLVDIGNTRIKWLLHSISQFHAEENVQGYPIKSFGSPVHAIDITTQDFATHLEQLWGKMDIPESVTVSVVGQQDVDTSVTGIAKRLWGITPIKVTTKPRFLDIQCGYKNFGELGVDRWYALIGARAVVSSTECLTDDLIVVDFGSATTIDVLAANGVHLGGVILPGIELQRRVLHNFTSQLPLVNDVPIKIFADSTRDAISTGTRIGAIAAANEFLKLYIERLSQRHYAKKNSSTNGNARIIVTGGAYSHYANNLEFPCEYHEDLVLLGLANFVAVKFLQQSNTEINHQRGIEE